jgi:YHS domain-containing protein
MRILKTISVVSLGLLLVLSVAGSSFAAAQTTCPVMGGDINKKLYADHNGERVYFCCMMCPPEFAKDPGKFIKKLKGMDQEPEKINQ